MNKSNYITASEMGDYVYCKRGWWLRLNGLLPDTQQMTDGIEQHYKLAALLATHKWKVLIAWIFLMIGIGMGLLYFVLSRL